MEEIWRPIPGYERAYEVSTLGRVRSIDHTTEYVRGDQIVVANYKGKLLLSHKRNNGYLYVGMYDNNHQLTKENIHRLVAITFIPNPENKPEVNHKDCNKENNCIDNLEWVTKKEHVEHTIENGRYLLAAKGEQVPSSKLTEEQAIQILRLLAEKKKGVEIAKMFPVSDKQISNMKRGLQWKHLPR